MSTSVKEENEGFQDQVVAINRVAKVVKGGRRFSFSALVVVGNRKDTIGFGVGKAGEVPDAIRKASEHAKKNLVTVNHTDGTIPIDVVGKFGSTYIDMYPAKSGKGIIAGGATRMIMELGGVKDIVCKIHGSRNGHNVVRATVDAIKQFRTMDHYTSKRGLELDAIVEKRVRTKNKNTNESKSK